MKELREFIQLFLQLNPSPADAQVHALASALGCDRESLEAVMYKLLGDTLNDYEINADSQEILDDPLADPDMMSLTDVALNDGDPTEDDLGYQEETLDDGSDTQDVAVGLTPTDGDALTNDGVPDISVGV